MSSSREAKKKRKEERSSLWGIQVLLHFTCPMIVHLAKFSSVYFPITIEGIDSSGEAEEDEVCVEVDRQAQSHLFLDHLLKYFHFVYLLSLPLHP